MFFKTLTYPSYLCACLFSLKSTDIYKFVYEKNRMESGHASGHYSCCLALCMLGSSSWLCCPLLPLYFRNLRFQIKIRNTISVSICLDPD